MNMSLSLPAIPRKAFSLNLQQGRGTIFDELITIFWLIFLPMEFAIGQPLRLPMMGVMLLMVAFHWRDVIPLLKRGWVYLLLPGFCIMSFFWSGSPFQSLRYGIFLGLMLVVAAWTASRLSHRQMVVAVLISGGLLCLWSAAAPDIQYSVGIDGGRAMTGVFPQKNVLGMRMLVLMMASVTIIISAGYALRWKVFAGVLVPPAIYLLIGSKSATAMILMLGSAALIFGLGIVWRGLGRLRGGRALMVCMAVITMSFGGLLVANVYKVDPVDAVLGKFGKDKTLTGRTDIWQVAEVKIDEHPMLGVGAGAFWNNNMNAAQKIAGMFQMEATNFYFHSAYYEVRVHIGIFGVLIFVITWVVALKALVSDWLQRERQLDPFFIGMAAILLARVFTESELFMVMLMNPLILWVGVFMALRRHTENAGLPTQRF